MSNLNASQVRRQFCSVLSRSGVTDFRDATNFCYYALFNLSAEGLRELYGLPEYANLRNSLPALPLAAITMLEAYVVENISRYDRYEQAVVAAADHIRTLLPSL
jgi:hypothetical protein